MKKTLITVLAVSLLVTMFCAQAMASYGDITVKTTKVYADTAMKEYVGSIPAFTALIVRSNDSYTDVYINGKVYYINPSTLLNKSLSCNYVAVLEAGTKIYQRADTDAASYKLQKNSPVQICKVKGEWALVQSLGERGLYTFVKISKLKSITRV